MDLAPYIGLPFVEQGRTLSGVDCWGLIYLIYGAEFHIALASYVGAYANSQEREEIAALIGRESLAWPEIPPAAAQPGDVLILRIAGRPWHCGLVVDPPRFLHADRAMGTVMERWDAPRWVTRLVAVHRHPRLHRSATSAGPGSGPAHPHTDSLRGGSAPPCADPVA